MPVADIYRVNKPRTSIEQDLGKAAGRCTNVEANAAFRVEPEVVESGCEFQPAPRDIGMGRTRSQGGVSRDFFGGLSNDTFVGCNMARLDCGLRFGAALEQAPLDQQAIDALSRCGHGRNPFKVAPRNNVSYTAVTGTELTRLQQRRCLPKLGETIWHVNIQKALPNTWSAR